MGKGDREKGRGIGGENRAREKSERVEMEGTKEIKRKGSQVVTLHSRATKLSKLTEK